MASKEIGLEVNVDKTKYMVMSGDQNAGQSHTMKVDNSSLKGWNSSSIGNNLNKPKLKAREEIKSRLKSGNACYHSEQNLFSSSLVPKNININPLKTNRRLLYLKTQFLPRSKLFISVIKTNQFMLYVAQVADCSQINTKHINTVWAERTAVEC